MADLTQLDSLLVPIRLHCPGVPENVAKDALLVKWREFCRLTEYWRENIDVTTTADTAAYALTPSATAVIERVVRVVYLDDNGNEGDPLPKTAYRLDSAASVSGSDLGVSSLVFERHYIPSETGRTVRAKVVLMPEWRASDADVPAWIINRYGEGLASGAISYLCSMLRSPYASLDLARLHRAQFMNAVAEASSEVEREGTNRTNQWRIG